MTGVTQHELVSDVAHDLISQHAPQELPLFSATSKAYFKNPKKTLDKRTNHDEALGFGVEAVVTFLTPIILAMVSDVVQYIAQEIKDSGVVEKMFKRFRHRDVADKKVPPPLTHEQMLKVRKRAFAKAREFNLPENQANLFADALIGEIVTDDT